MKTIICVTGKSIAGGTPEAAGIAVGIDQGVETYRNALWTRVNGLPEATRAKLAAEETRKLLEIGVTAADEVVLLFPDTPEDTVCAEVLRYFIAERMGIPTSSRGVANPAAAVAEEKKRAGDAGREIFLLGQESPSGPSARTGGREKGRKGDRREGKGEKRSEADAALVAEIARLTAERDEARAVAAAAAQEAGMVREAGTWLRFAHRELDAVRAECQRRFRLLEESEAMLKAARAENRKLATARESMEAASEAVDATLRITRHELSRLKTEMETVRGERDRLQQRFASMSRTALLPWSLWWGEKKRRDP
ncbi:MAG: hypothetical protein ABT940_05175 [Alphaproteobacteria bacterium]